MKPPRTGWMRWMPVVILTFCFLNGVLSVPIYPPVGVPAYVPVYDPYSAAPAYPATIDPYAGSPVYVPSVDVYYQVPPPVSYPTIDPYAAYPPPVAYPAVDPYGMPPPYPSVDPYGLPSSYPQAYPAVDPYGLPSSYPSAYPAVNPYPEVIVYPPTDPYQAPYPMPQPDPYSPQPYPSIVDPYSSSSYPQPQPYPSYDIYSAPAPYPAIDSYSLSVPPSYAVAPAYPSPPPTPSYVVEDDTYLAITSHSKDRRKHCGIIPVTNDDIYSSDPMPGGVNDVLPYGAFPWLALVVDLDDYSVACLGTVIHSEYVLTTASCITKPAGKYTVVRDWDILTIYNEYEAYKSYADPVCTYWPLGIDNTTGQSQYQLGGFDAELILLIGPLEEHHSEYPADKTLCLPSRASTPPTPYGYPTPSPYQPPSLYSPYPQLTYDPYSYSPIPTGECWVAGYYNSPTAVLQNHPPAVAMSGQQPPQQSSPPYQQYYNSLDNSKVPRRALVRQIQCPADRPSAGADDVCFVGVNGYDACVADQGTAIVCVIDDSSQYESGFADDPTSDHGTLPEGISSANPPPYQPPQQSQQIQAAPAQPKPNRRRGILYGVVKATTTCLQASPGGYPPNPQQQSNYIVGARVSPSIKSAIQDLFWETGYDLSCPTERTGDVLPTSPVGQPVPMQPPLPSNLQPQYYDVSIPNPPYPQPNPIYSLPPPYPQDIYSG